MMRLWPKMRFLLTKFSKDERGATAIEYGLIAAGVAIAILAAVFAIGEELNDFFLSVADALELEARCVEAGSNCQK